MRKVALIALLLFGPSSSAFAQRVEAGIFLDYLDISQTSTNNFGLGARFGYRVHRDVMLEGELAYDYGINFDEAYRNLANGNIAVIERTSIGVHTRFVRSQAPAFGRWIPSLRHAQRRLRGFPPRPQLAPLQRSRQHRARPSHLQPERRHLSGSRD